MKRKVLIGQLVQKHQDHPLGENPKIDASQDKGDKGRNKHKCKKSKVTFAQLLDKYQKKSEEKSAYRPTNAKASRSPQAQI